MKRYDSVDDYLAGTEHFHDELLRLRKILNATKLEETVKWGGPCYTHGGKNIVGMGAFKSYCGLWFYQGALLSDPDKVLINAQQGRTKALRQWRFQAGDKIPVGRIKSYVAEAIRLSSAGNEIKPDRSRPLAIPAELTSALGANAKAKSGFAALTKGKQREYAEYIADAKRAETKLKRLEKILPMIVAGQGLNDRYRR